MLHHHSSLLPRLLDLDSQIHAPILAEAMAIVAELAGPVAKVRRVLDIGSGTGTATITLTRLFPAAEIVAVDINETMLATVRDRAREAGLAHRVVATRADIAGTTQLEPVDVAWAAASLHEVSDPNQAFRNIFAALRPGGSLFVMEMDAPPMVLPARFAALESRVRAAAGGPAAHPLDWVPAISAAGFTLERIERLRADSMFTAEGVGGEFALLELRRLAAAVLPRLNDYDRAALAALSSGGTGSVRELGEVWIRGSRTLWAATRP